LRVNYQLSEAAFFWEAADHFTEYQLDSESSYEVLSMLQRLLEVDRRVLGRQPGVYLFNFGGTFHAGISLQKDHENPAFCYEKATERQSYGNCGHVNCNPTPARAIVVQLRPMRWCFRPKHLRFVRNDRHQYELGLATTGIAATSPAPTLLWLDRRKGYPTPLRSSDRGARIPGYLQSGEVLLARLPHKLVIELLFEEREGVQPSDKNLDLLWKDFNDAVDAEASNVAEEPQLSAGLRDPSDGLGLVKSNPMISHPSTSANDNIRGRTGAIHRLV
jgi:hypothetical protein